MPTPFFPDPALGWIYLTVLLALLAAAAYTDLGRMVVPKRVTLTALALGVVLNLVRGFWLGVAGLSTWQLGAGSGWVGAADGLLFALAGFALGFTLFFVMWILGTCGGGDVKLFAAVGAWVGPYLAVCVLAMTLVVVVAVVFARLVFRLVRGERRKAPTSPVRPGSLAGGKGKLQPRQRVLGFSLPLAIATALVLLWAFRVDLQFVTAPALAAAQAGSHAH